jgi:hypothetical protein
MRRFGIFVSASLLLVSTGCRHRPVTVIPVAAHAPVALEPTPEHALPPAVASVPTQAPPVASVPLPAKKVRRVRHRSTLPTAAPQPSTPVEMASESPPPIAAVIGLLTTGEDASPATQQHAADLIASNDKRLKALSPEEVADHRSAVTRVSNFDRDATVALKTGDASGAITLATKAQVLLDDLNK